MTHLDLYGDKLTRAYTKTNWFEHGLVMSCQLWGLMFVQGGNFKVSTKTVGNPAVQPWTLTVKKTFECPRLVPVPSLPELQFVVFWISVTTFQGNYRRPVLVQVNIPRTFVGLVELADSACSQWWQYFGLCHYAYCSASRQFYYFYIYYLP